MRNIYLIIKIKENRMTVESFCKEDFGAMAEILKKSLSNLTNPANPNEDNPIHQKDLPAGNKAANSPYESAITSLRPYMNKILDFALLPGSKLEGIESVREFFSLVKAGQRGLITSEHYSNLDLPIIIALMERAGVDCSGVVAVAGRKLNDDSPFVRAFAAAYSRVVITPSRHMTDPAIARVENFSAMRAMDRLARAGHAILVFPAGTRAREGRPETRRGLREIDSYLRLFDIILPLAIDGCPLRITDESDMLKDELEPCLVRVAAGGVLKARDFRREAQKVFKEKGAADGVDEKQFIVDELMTRLNKLHNESVADN